MAKVHKIQDRDWLYAILRPWVDYGLKRSYRSIRYIGREKLPQDGAIIYAPNHTNGLMDALVILAMDRRAKVFVARADLFRNPLLAKILTFLKIMPIMRIRDGYEEVKKNNETIEKAVDVLRDRVPFCIFPEGTHQPKHSALPLSKGIFRIALQAQQQMPDLPLYIVPVGIRYGNFFRFRSTARVAIGDPIA
ncbi:MAG: 1-acyl-sn-glycerol-3-phosphate acyltransferase, partial [Alistipes sp.]|nr:1-acyl-sn-glycerol-3-phosphate acyltransferase [Alistipes sp.]